MSYNSTLPLVSSETRVMFTADTYTDELKSSRTVAFSLTVDRSCTINVYTYQFSTDTQVLTATQTTTDYLFLQVKLVKRYIKVVLINNVASAMSVFRFVTEFKENNDLNILSDVNGTPISSLNKLYTYSEITNATPIDITLDGINTTANALNVYNTNNISSIQIRDSSNNPLNATGSSLNVNLTNNPSVKLQDASGNNINSTSNALNVYQTNAGSGTTNIKDSSGNNLNSTSNALNSYITNTYLYARLRDTAGNEITTTNGGLNVSDYNNDVLNGVYNDGVNNNTTSGKFSCYRSAVATAGSDITTNTADSYPYSTFSTGIYVYAVSDSANDTNSAGSGARQITIEGIDDMGANVSSIVSLAGTTNSSLADSLFFRINRVFVSSAGSSATNAGKITVKSDGSNIELANIVAGYSITQNSNYTVKPTETIILRQCEIQPNGQLRIDFLVKPNATGIWRVIDTFYAVNAGVKDLNLRLVSDDEFLIRGYGMAGSESAYIQITYYSTSL